MDSRSKMCKSGSGIISVVEDRLSSLPDDTLIQILSLLPTKNAAAICVLSKGLWRVFPLLTSLDFDVSPISLCMEHPYAVELYPSFVTFVCNVLQAYQSPIISRFRLGVGSVDFDTRFSFFNRPCQEGCLPDIELKHLDAWVSFPLTLQGLRELDLCILVRKPGDGQLSPSIFKCETLEVLKLEVNLDLNQVITMPSYHLPNLKLLHLSASHISDDKFLPRIVSSCPLLEDLTFQAFVDDGYCATISSSSLRRLRLLIQRNCPDNSELVCIHTPNLECLEYWDNYSYKYSIPIMHRLVKAYIMFELILQAYNRSYLANLRQMVSLMRSLSRVQHLKLLGDFLAVCLNLLF